MKQSQLEIYFFYKKGEEKHSSGLTLSFYDD